MCICAEFLPHIRLLCVPTFLSFPGIFPHYPHIMTHSVFAILWTSYISVAEPQTKITRMWRKLHSKEVRNFTLHLFLRGGSSGRAVLDSSIIKVVGSNLAWRMYVCPRSVCSAVLCRYRPCYIPITCPRYLTKMFKRMHCFRSYFWFRTGQRA